MKKIKRNNSFPDVLPCLIGVDGGGTKTTAAVADLSGRILAVAKSGPSNPVDIGLERATINIAEAIGKALKTVKRKKRIVSTFIGLAAVEEGFGIQKGEIEKGIMRRRQARKITEGKIVIGSDQIVAFRAGSNERNGIGLISGTGCAIHGWCNGKEAKASGWGWLEDEGSGFWTGQKVFQAIFKDLDGRGEKTLLTKLVFKELGVETKEDLLAKIYSGNPIMIIPLFSIYCDMASIRGDKVASRILEDAGKGLAFSAITVIKKLDFQKKKFPLVLIGGMFKSKIVLEILKKEVKKAAPQVEFILSREEPVIGAIKLAKEEFEKLK